MINIKVEMLRRFLTLTALVLLSSCAEIGFDSTGKVATVSAPPCYANEQRKISLLNPMTRNIIHCYTSAFTSAEECARKYENKNYVRFRDIPYKTANYDFLHRDTYPTRRWRMGERTPRW